MIGAANADAFGARVVAWISAVRSVGAGAGGGCGAGGVSSHVATTVPSGPEATSG